MSNIKNALINVNTKEDFLLLLESAFNLMNFRQKMRFLEGAVMCRLAEQNVIPEVYALKEMMSQELAEKEAFVRAEGYSICAASGHTGFYWENDEAAGEDHFDKEDAIVSAYENALKTSQDSIEMQEIKPFITEMLEPIPMTTIRLTIDVSYATNGQSIAALAANLNELGGYFIDSNNLTDGKGATVEDYKVTSSIRPAPLTEGELLDYFEDLLEDGEISLKTLPERFVRYGTAEPDAFIDEMRERVALKAEEE